MPNCHKNLDYGWKTVYERHLQANPDLTRILGRKEAYKLNSGHTIDLCSLTRRFTPN